ncbi:hypothetical protein DV515_00006261 [Chloebia gouldiae]|uniref:Uncharacterized protein n=1 Tax=Chloebia gouldiae TaxID=44316 RepID=A0A3L8SL70_CHLGU|nr:hypothetical protein DV515_00006261 [Chloebia gouldiae]
MAGIDLECKQLHKEKALEWMSITGSDCQACEVIQKQELASKACSANRALNCPGKHHGPEVVGHSLLLQSHISSADPVTAPRRNFLLQVLSVDKGWLIFSLCNPHPVGLNAHPCTFYAVQGSVCPEDNVSCLAHSADETVRDTPEVN